MTTQPGWYDVVSVERAASLLGYRSFEALCADRCVNIAHARSYATGAWQANEREHYVAWRSIAEHTR